MADDTHTTGEKRMVDARLVLIWQLDASWRYDPALRTEVEVRFVALGPSETRVEFEHRGLEAYGDEAERLRKAFGGADGSSELLEAYGTITSLAPGPERSRSHAAGASSSATRS